MSRVSVAAKMISSGIKEFGFFTGLKLSLYNFCGNDEAVSRLAENYLRNKYKDIIEKYKKIEKEQGGNFEAAERSVWALWLTGYDTAPDIVKLSAKSLTENAGNIKINLLDEESALKLVSVPEHITEKYKKGNIGPAHYSDVIRCLILKKYGGLWLDAKIFLSGEIDEKIFNMPFYSPHFYKTTGGRFFVADRRWICGLMGSGIKETLLFSFVSEMYESYWKDHDVAIVYLLLDQLIDLAYNNFLSVKTDIDSTPIKKEKLCYWLRDRLYDKFDKEEWERIKSSENFHILSRKLISCDDKDTYYYKVLNPKGE